MSPYTKLAVRSLGPASGLTLEQHRDVPAVVRVPPSGGTRRHGLSLVPNGSLAWKDDAACKGKSADLFYGEEDADRSASKTARMNREAKKVCATCTVREPCLKFALANNERWGVFGGLTPAERGRLSDSRFR